MKKLLTILMIVFLLCTPLEAGLRFGGQTLRDKYVEMNTVSQVGVMIGFNCANADDTEILFMNGDDCEGDPDLIWAQTTNLMTIGSGGDVTFTSQSPATSNVLSTANQSASNISADWIMLQGGNGNGTGDGGSACLVGGDGGTTSGAGGDVVLDAGDGKGTGAGGDVAVNSGAGGGTSGDSGNITFDFNDPISGHAGSYTFNSSEGVGTNKNGTSFNINLGGATGSGQHGRTIISRSSATGLTAETEILLVSRSTSGLASGTTLSDNRYVQILQPTLNGVAGGATETCTTCSALYIEGPYTGSDITFTNNYALFVDSGDIRLGGDILFEGLTSNLESFGFDDAEDDFKMTNDLNLYDVEPHLTFYDTDPSSDDYHFYADGNQFYLTNLQDGEIFRVNQGNEIILSRGIVGKKEVSDPCSGKSEGHIFYNDTSDYYCFCNGSGNDVQMHSPSTSCF